MKRVMLIICLILALTQVNADIRTFFAGLGVTVSQKNDILIFYDVKSPITNNVFDAYYKVSKFLLYLQNYEHKFKMDQVNIIVFVLSSGNYQLSYGEYQEFIRVSEEKKALYLNDHLNRAQ
jgi:hypothetical protein